MPSVLITGAGRGIGLTTTSRLAAAGWDVYAGARSDGHLRALGRIERVHPVPLDVTDRAAVAALPDHLPDRLDAVVNNAGIVVQGPVEAVPIDTFARQLEVNVTGQVAVTQAVLPAIRAARGRVVFISSISGRVSTPLTGVYSTSKFALEGMADALRIELRQWGIRVILVEPGPTRTDMWTGILDEFDEMERGLSDEHRNLYASQLAGTRAALPWMAKLTVPADRVATTVEKALTSTRPRRRYLCDTASRLQVGATAVTPSAITDAVLSAVTRR